MNIIRNYLPLLALLFLLVFQFHLKKIPIRY